MRSLRFRAPGVVLPLDVLLSRAWPGLPPAQLAALVQKGRVKVDREVATDPARRYPPGLLIEADGPGQVEADVAGEARVIAEGPDWVVVEKPAGLPSHPAREGGPCALAWIASRLGVERTELWPVHRLDADVSGVWLLARTREAAARLSQSFDKGHARKTYAALSPRVEPWSGRIRAPIDDAPAETLFEVVEQRGDVSALRLIPVTGRTHQLRRHLAQLQAPLLGDVLYGGVLVAGGLRLRSIALTLEGEGIDVQLPFPDDWWPSEPIHPEERGFAPVVVSVATLRALDKGHPWVLTDTETGDMGKVRPGALARLTSPRGERGAVVRVEGTGVIAARLWSHRGPGPTVAERVESALGDRRPLLSPTSSTSAFRLIHGEADGLPGLHVDHLGPCLRALVTGRAAWGFREEVYELLRERFPGYFLLEVAHLRDLRTGDPPRARLLWGSAPDSDERLTVYERGLAFLVDPWEGPSYGLFPDQRDNRRRVAALARPGSHWLNTFAHTGAFSLALLRAGARVTSVDLSRPYLNWLEDNLQTAGIRGEHQSVKKDVRAFLEGCKDTFDGIVIDPPTAASAGGRFWSSREGMPELLGLALDRLKRGGALLLCRNDRHRRPALRELLERAVSRKGRDLIQIEDAPPSADYPRVEGFPEGDTFEAILAKID